MVFEKYVKEKTNGIDIEWTDNERIYFKYHVVGKLQNGSVQCYTKQSMLRLQNDLCKYLDAIRDNSVFKYCEYDVMQAITEIEENSVFYTYSEMVRYSDCEISFKDVKERTLKFRACVDGLKQMVFLDDCYEIEDAKLDEKIIIDLLSDNGMEKLKTIENLNKQINKEHIRSQIKMGLGNKVDETTLNEIVDKIIKGDV